MKKLNTYDAYPRSNVLILETHKRSRKSYYWSTRSAIHRFLHSGGITIVRDKYKNIITKHINIKKKRQRFR